MFAITHAFHRGDIIVWYGFIADIRAGWAECNGLLGTPDLTARFVVGACPACPVGTTGGNAIHGHDFVDDGHSHNMAYAAAIQSGTPFASFTAEGNAAGTTDDSSSLPPFYSLAYIMKL